MDKRYHYREKSMDKANEEKEETEAQEVIEIDSEDSREGKFNENHNNEDSLTDRQQDYENEQNNGDSDRDSASSDIVVVRDDYQNFYEIEELSRIETNGAPLDPKDKVSIKNFKIHKLLGTGAYGKVFSVEKLDGIDKGQMYAMKVLEKQKVTQKKKTTEHTRTEREVLERVIDCPFLVTMYYSFQTAEKLYLIMEFVQGGELFSHLYKSEHFTEDQTRFYIAEIIVALEQLHNQNIIYRDIKLENILLDKEGHIIVTDFGLSKVLRNGNRTYSYCGTIEYMAPEIVNPKNGHDQKVDWWSVGVLTIELLSGQSPFSRDNEESNNNQQIISERIQNSEPIIPETINADAKDLILKLLEKNPQKRLGSTYDAKELKEHRFFRNIDWNILKEKKYRAPMIPHVRDKFDVSQFSEDFTAQQAIDGPAENGPPQGPRASRYFRGYSFVASQFRSKNPVVAKHEVELMRPHEQDVFDVQNRGKSRFFKQYRISEDHGLIGDGTYSICMRCTSKEDGNRYAVKIMNLDHDASHEIQALKRCQGHQNIVKLIDTKKDDHFTYVVCELLDGDELFSRIRKNGYLEEDVARDYLHQICAAVRFMHSKNIVHRDLKPENIKFVRNSKDSNQETLKILDFGFAHLESRQELPPCFTLDYAAPESLVKGSTKKSRDMWSIGVILYTMLIGNTPFVPERELSDERSYRQKVTEKIRKGEFNKNVPRWKKISQKAQDLISKLLTVDEKRRMKMSELTSNSWAYPKEQDLSSRMETESNASNSDEIDDEFMAQTMKYLGDENLKPLSTHSSDSDETIPNDFDTDNEGICEEADEQEENHKDANIETELPPKVVNRESRSNDDSSSGIVMSDRNEGSSGSSHHEEIEEPPVQMQPKESEEAADKAEPKIIQDSDYPLEEDEQLEPEDLSLKHQSNIECNNNDQISPAAESAKEIDEMEFKGFTWQEIVDDELPFMGFPSKDDDMNHILKLYEKLLGYNGAEVKEKVLVSKRRRMRRRRGEIQEPYEPSAVVTRARQKLENSLKENITSSSPVDVDKNPKKRSRKRKLEMSSTNEKDASEYEPPILRRRLEDNSRKGERNSAAVAEIIIKKERQTKVVKISKLPATDTNQPKKTRKNGANNDKTISKKETKQKKMTSKQKIAMEAGLPPPRRGRPPRNKDAMQAPAQALTLSPLQPSQPAEQFQSTSMRIAAPASSSRTPITMPTIKTEPKRSTVIREQLQQQYHHKDPFPYFCSDVQNFIPPRASPRYIDNRNRDSMILFRNVKTEKNRPNNSTILITYLQTPEMIENEEKKNSGIVKVDKCRY